MEGSTGLLRELGDDYAVVLRDHNALLLEGVEGHGGRVVDTQGDSFFCVFPRVRDAVAAAADAQRGLAAHGWPQGARVRVRMGVHAAEPELEGGRYVGLGVHRAARVGSAAHGGQVLLSNAAASMLGDSKVELRDLGAHALKDFEKPERLFQLQVEGVSQRFPPPRTGRRRSRRRWLVLAAVVVVAAAIALPLVLTGGSSGVKVGPTSLAVIDPKTNKVVDAIDLGFKSRLIAAGDGYVWVADPGTSTLVKIDPKSRKIVSRTAISADAIPIGIAAGLGAVWVTVQRGQTDDALLKIDPDLGSLQSTLTLGHLSAGLGADLVQTGVTVGGGFVWTVENAENRISRIDPGTLERKVVTRSLPQATDAIDFGAGGVWVGGQNVATRTDPQTGATTATAPLGGPSDVAAITVGDGSVWYTASADTVAWRLDPANVQPRGTAPVGQGPTGVAAGAGGVWVASSVSGTVSRIDPRSAETVATIRLRAAGGVVVSDGLVWVSPGQPTTARAG
jgi:streptogramin lyase